MGNRRDLVFLGLAICMLVAAIFFVRSRSVPVSHHRQARHEQAKATEAKAVTPVKPMEEKALLASSSPLGKARNPFQAPVKPRESTAPKPAPAVTPPGLPPVAPAAATAATPGAALPPLSPQTTATTTPAASAGPTLTGVIGGTTSHPTAVIRTGDKRYFARQGDKVAGRYTVQSVSDQKVVLVSTEGKLTLKMGGS